MSVPHSRFASSGTGKASMPRREPASSANSQGSRTRTRPRRMQTSCSTRQIRAPTRVLMRFSRFLSVAGTSAGQERDVNRHAARAQIREHLLGSIETKRRVLEACPENIARAAELMAETFRRGGKILLCGNGGSAADCQHMAAELVSSLRKDVDRPGLPAIAL